MGGRGVELGVHRLNLHRSFSPATGRAYTALSAVLIDRLAQLVIPDDAERRSGTECAHQLAPPGNRGAIIRETGEYPAGPNLSPG